MPGRLAARLGDGPGWRAVAYLLLKLPLALFELYAAGVFVAAGLVNVTYPFWWQSFRNHPSGVRLSPVTVITPFDPFGNAHFRVAIFPGTFAAFAAGAGDRDDRVLLRRGVAGQRGQAQPGE